MDAKYTTQRNSRRSRRCSSGATLAIATPLRLEAGRGNVLFSYSQQSSMTDSDSSSEGEIDYEKERLRSLASRRMRRHDACAEKVRVTEVLRQYREQQSLKRNAEAENLRAHFSAASRDSVRPSNLSKRIPGNGGGAALQEWEDHEKRWTIFESMLTSGNVSRLCERDIPWPPAMEGILQSMAWGRARIIENTSEETIYKQTYHKAARRWHPDKFMSKVGSVVEESSHARVMERVMAIAQQLNREWRELKPEHET